MRTLSLTPKAESDLIDIWVYTCEEWGVDQADDDLDQLYAGMRPLILDRLRPCSSRVSLIAGRASRGVLSSAGSEGASGSCAA